MYVCIYVGRAAPTRPSNLDPGLVHFATLFKNRPLICFVLHKKSSSFSNITEIDILEKNLGIANVNCSSQAFIVF